MPDDGRYRSSPYWFPAFPARVARTEPLLANYRGASVWHVIELLSVAKLKRRDTQPKHTVTGRLFLYVSIFLLEHNIIWLSTFFVDKKSFKTV